MGADALQGNGITNVSVALESTEWRSTQHRTENLIFPPRQGSDTFRRASQESAQVSYHSFRGHTISWFWSYFRHHTDDR